jgi:alpha-ketoglutarate-dependent taurine dioxygenase
METGTMMKQGPGKPGSVKRKAVDASAAGDLVQISSLSPDQPLPLLLTPAIGGVDLIAWAARNRELLGARLLEHGGILCRGFGPLSPAEFQRLIEAVSGEALKYTYRSTPRSEVEGNIYTSTEYPADQPIPMHNEMSYSATWPLKIWFLCAIPAETGGETPIADSRRIYQRIDPEVRETFARKGVMYVRNCGGGVDLPWQNVFQTRERAEVEAFCGQAGIQWEWRGGDRLRTRQVCQATARHPVTGDMVWFNQAHLFHVSSLKPEVRRSLLTAFAADELPRNAYYGDGTPIPDDVLDHIRKVFDEESVKFPWQLGDVMLLDNMLAAHGRTPFTGARRILAGMAEPHDPGAARIEQAGG